MENIFGLPKMEDLMIDLILMDFLFKINIKEEK